MTTTEHTTVVHPWIGGKAHESTSGRTAPAYDPARGVITKHVALADARAAIEAAQEALPAWRDLSTVRIQVGIVGVDVPIPVPVAYHSFAGWKQSLWGSSKADGAAGFEFFTREKAITQRWLAPSHGGLHLGFTEN